MAIQQTLCIIKPDAVALGEVESICYRLSTAGLKAIKAKQHQLTSVEAEAFYAEHRHKDFFAGCVQLMTSGPSYIQILEGDDAIFAYRAIMGPTDPKKAPSGTLRADFGGKVLPSNAVHGSDSPESAQREIQFFFKD